MFVIKSDVPIMEIEVLACDQRDAVEIGWRRTLAHGSGRRDQDMVVGTRLRDLQQQMRRMEEAHGARPKLAKFGVQARQQGSAVLHCPERGVALLDADERESAVAIAETDAGDQADRPELQQPIVECRRWSAEGFPAMAMPFGELCAADALDVGSHGLQQVIRQGSTGAFAHERVRLRDGVGEKLAFEVGHRLYYTSWESAAKPRTDMNGGAAMSGL